MLRVQFLDKICRFATVWMDADAVDAVLHIKGFQLSIQLLEVL